MKQIFRNRFFINILVVFFVVSLINTSNINAYPKSVSNENSTNKLHHRVRNIYNESRFTKTKLYINSEIRYDLGKVPTPFFSIDIVHIGYSLLEQRFLILQNINLQTCKVKFSNFQETFLSLETLEQLLNKEWDLLVCEAYNFDASRLSLPFYTKDNTTKLSLLQEELSVTFLLSIDSELEFKSEHYADDTSTTDYCEYDIDLGYLAYNISNFKLKLNPKELKIMRLLKKIQNGNNAGLIHYKEITQAPITGEKTGFDTIQRLFINGKMTLKQKEEFLEHNKSNKSLEVYFDNELLNLDDERIVYKKEGDDDDDDDDEHKENNDDKKNRVNFDNKDNKRSKAIMITLIVAVSIICGVLIISGLVYLVCFKRSDLEDYSSN